MLLISLAILSFPFAESPDLNEAAPFLRVLGNAYRANREAVIAGQFVFEETTGLAETLQAARTAQQTVLTTAHGYYAFSGGLARFERTADLAEMRRTTHVIDKTHKNIGIICVRGLTDGRVELFDILDLQPSLNNISHKAFINDIGEFYQRMTFPLALGNPRPKDLDLSQDIERLLAGEYALEEWTPHLIFEGRPVSYLKIKCPYGSRSYWVDMERGGNPLRIRDEVSASNIHDVCYDGWEFDQKNVWFPRVETIYSVEGFYTRISLKNVEINPSLPKSTFQLEFPTPISVRNQAINVIYKPRKMWSLLNLPHKDSSLATPMDLAPQSPPAVSVAMPGERNSRSVWSMVLLGFAGVLFLAGVAGWWWTRSRR